MNLTRGIDACMPSTSARCAHLPSGAIPRSQRSRRGGRQVCLDSLGPYAFAMWRDELPVQPGQDDGILGLRTVSTPMLSPQKVFDRLYNGVHLKAAEHFGAFYSSELGGIVTNPAFMVIHMDDHMVHRGHAVFDTVLLTGGYLYQLPQHFERFKKSAHMAGIKLPLSDEAIMRVILDTAAASKKTNGILKYWVSAGRGGFGLSSSECVEETLYCICTSENTEPVDRTVGLSACSSPIVPKPYPFGTLKSTNYLQNVLAKIQAEEAGLDVGVFVDSDGFILEGPNSNFALLTQDNVFVTPPFDNVLAGVTIQRLMELIPGEHANWPSDITVERIEQRPVHSDEVLKAKEVFLIGSSHLVVSLTSWNNEKIGDGRPGSSSLAFGNILENDKVPREGSTQHIEVPYGYMTGMRGQLV